MEQDGHLKMTTIVAMKKTQMLYFKQFMHLNPYIIGMELPQWRSMFPFFSIILYVCECYSRRFIPHVSHLITIFMICQACDAHDEIKRLQAGDKAESVGCQLKSTFDFLKAAPQGQWHKEILKP